MKKYIVEFLGTFWLIFGGCGSAIFSANNLGIGNIGISLAFGLSIITMFYSLGKISGAHFNPAVSVGLFFAGRLTKFELIPYIISQIFGAIAASFILYTIYNSNIQPIDNSISGAFAANGYSHLSPNGYGLIPCFIVEFLLTALLLIIILSVTNKQYEDYSQFSGIIIGLSIILIHLISIPITNTSVNPARSTSQAIFVGGEYLNQLWLFWVSPCLGAICGSYIYKIIFQEKK